MMTKTTFALGFGAGYVLGSKAGRQRYEQIRRATSSFLGRPAVQDAAEMIKEQAGGAISTAKKAVTSKIGHNETDTAGTAYAGVGTGRVDPYPA